MKLLRQIFSIIFTRWIILILSFITGVLLARVLGPEGKGILSLLGTFITLLGVVAGFGLPTAASYLFKTKQSTIAEIITIALLSILLVSVVIGLLLFLYSELIIDLLIGELEGTTIQKNWIWISFAMLPGVLVSSLLSVLLIIDNRNQLYIFWNVGGQVLGVLLTITFVILLNLGIVGALLSSLAVQLVPIGILLYWLSSFNQTERRLQFSLTALKRIFAIGFQQYYVSVVATIFKRGENVLLAFLLDIQSLGLFSVALTLVDLVIDIPRSIVWPMVGRLTDETGKDQIESTAKSIRFQNLVLIFLLTFIAIIGPFFIQIAYGASFRPSAYLFLYLLPAVLFRSLHLGTLSYFVSNGKPGALSFAITISAFINLALGFLLIPKVGLIGAVEATLVGEGLLALLSVWKFTNTSGLNWSDVLIPKANDFRAIRRFLAGVRISTIFEM